MPTSMLGTNQTRLFEGSRLLFGFILETATALKLPTETTSTPYISAFETIDVRNYKTFEATLNPINTDKGMLKKRSLFRELQESGRLTESQLQDYPIAVDSDQRNVRLTVLGGGASEEVTAFSHASLRAAYTYIDKGRVDAAIDLNEMRELEHPAELSGRNKLAVHRRRQLTSAVTPCLTFDRRAHVAVYLGDQSCGIPGQSSLVFQPKEGESTMDTAVVEQLIAPIIRTYEADGTAVLDALGGAAVRRMQEPDEILTFCVDCSASMGDGTDFYEINDDPDSLPSTESEAQKLVAGDFYSRLTFDHTKERFCKHESIADMIAIVAEVSNDDRREAALKVLHVLRLELSNHIVQKSKWLEDMRTRMSSMYTARARVSELENEVVQVKEFWAALKTHETIITDFLVYRAVSDARDISASGPGRSMIQRQP